MTVHADDGSFRVHYRIECDGRWRARRVHARSTTGGAIDLHADGAGHWTTAQGARLPALDGAIDVDIAPCAVRRAKDEPERAPRTMGAPRRPLYVSYAPTRTAAANQVTAATTMRAAVSRLHAPRNAR
jgi:hypothetical protein